VTLLSACANNSIVHEIPLPPWAESGPTVSDVQGLYPTAAYLDDIAGNVTLSCKVLETQKLECSVEAEEPPGHGFGEAAVILSRKYVVRPPAQDSRLAVGSQIRFSIGFKKDWP
jgi:periplasmic protein TonB